MAEEVSAIFDYPLSSDMLRQIETLHINTRTPYEDMANIFEAIKHN